MSEGSFGTAMGQSAGILADIREEIIPGKLNIIKFQRELIKQGVNSGRK